VLVTFEPHPLAVVNPAAAPKLLTLAAEKEALVQAQGIDRFVLMPFTPAVAQLDAEAFVGRLCDEYGMHELVMGYDHGFRPRARRRRRAGRAVGAAARFSHGSRRRGPRQRAADFVDVDPDGGRSRGFGLRGALVGAAVCDTWESGSWCGTGADDRIPTINLEPPDPRKLLPPDGVYAVSVTVGRREAGNEKRYGGMMNQGPRPTFGDQARTLEVHLFDFDGELYGETVDVEWVRRLRDVQAFRPAMRWWRSSSATARRRGRPSTGRARRWERFVSGCM